MSRNWIWHDPPESVQVVDGLPDISVNDPESDVLKDTVSPSGTVGVIVAVQIVYGVDVHDTDVVVGVVAAV